MDLESHSI